MTGLALAILAVALSWLLPPVLARASWLQWVPRAGVVLWQCVALAAVLAAIGAVLAAPEEAWRALSDEAQVGPALFLAAAAAGIGAGIIVVRLLVTTVRLGLDTRRRRARHNEMLDLLQSPTSDRVHVLASAVPMAYCVPGQAGRVVVTEAAMRMLDEKQVDAVIEHERAHLRARHDLVREAFTALHVAFPRLVRSAVAREAVDHLLEILADQAARRQVPTEHLRTALAELARTHPEPRTRARLDLLDRPGPSGWKRRLLAGMAYVMAAGVLVVPTAVLAGPWLSTLR